MRPRAACQQLHSSQLRSGVGQCAPPAPCFPPPSRLCKPPPGGASWHGRAAPYIGPPHTPRVPMRALGFLPQWKPRAVAPTRGKPRARARFAAPLPVRPPPRRADQCCLRVHAAMRPPPHARLAPPCSPRRPALRVRHQPRAAPRPPLPRPTDAPPWRHSRNTRSRSPRRRRVGSAGALPSPGQRPPPPDTSPQLSPLRRTNRSPGCPRCSRCQPGARRATRAKRASKSGLRVRAPRRGAPTSTFPS
mmetsp:Transcript_87749/g.246562  ORF Transcript_87749/g.246562 Transcript_87749/m.246562 type:complete len:247 (+) Transcript_87749:550-1290(+)